MPANVLATLNLVDLLLDAVCVVDAQGRYLFVSPAYERIFGYAAEDVVGRPMIELVHPADRERTLEAARDIMSGRDQFHFENRYVRKDGRIAHIRWTARWLSGPGVRVAVAHDISQRKRQEAVQAVLHAISEAAHTAPGLHALCVQICELIGRLIPSEGCTIALYDASAQTLSFPTGLGACRTWGVESENEPQRGPFSPCLQPHSGAMGLKDGGKWTAAAHLQPTIPKSDRLLEPAGLTAGPMALTEAPAYAQVLRGAEPVRWTPESAAPLPWPAGPAGCLPQARTCWIGLPLPGPKGPIGVLGLWLQQPSDLEIEADASLLQYIATQVASAVERKRMHQRLEHMARHDLLTGLPNRAHLHEQLQAALHRAQPSGDRVDVLFLDLDDFKRVNDTLGHSAGDQLLCEVAQRLRHAIPDRHLLARLGGDEFVVVVEHGASHSEAADLQARIGMAFEPPFHISGTGLRMRPSLGHAVFPDHAGDADGLLRRADAAMYAHKRRAPSRPAQA